MHRTTLLMATVCLTALVQVASAQQVMRLDGVVVSYTGISDRYARAIGRTVAAARDVAAEQYGFDMPQTIVVKVAVNANGRSRLFNDGQDQFSLTVGSERDLRQPRDSHIFHLYGLCHEVGHLAMYRPIHHRDWLTAAAAEGWAHWLGSQLVDAVYRREGPALWPDRYDYRADGTARLRQQFASSRLNDTQQGARLWDSLHQIVGDRGIAPIFEAWASAKFDPSDPAVALGSTFDGDVSSWWDDAADTFVKKRPRSQFDAGNVSVGRLSGRPRELAHDDGRQAGKRSIAGSGHAVRFATPRGQSFCVTAVKLFGSRYGRRATSGTFRVWICDDDFRSIADFTFPYDQVAYASPRWHTFAVTPTRVPAKFIICFGFTPTATKGVYVGHDGRGSRHSLTGLPGGSLRGFDAGDWMIRATVEQLKQPAAKPSSADLPMRQWTSADGKYEVEAKFVDLRGGKLRLEKPNGKIITVALRKISRADRKYVRQLRAGDDSR